MNRDFESGFVIGMWVGAGIVLFIIWTAGQM
jgi:hypothetical protein